jgi:hypothetical protein
MLALRIAGITNDFWSGLGLVAVIFLFVATTYFPAYGKVMRIVFTVWLVTTILLPFFFHSLPAVLQNALTSKQLRTTIRFAEDTASYGAGAARVRQAYCFEEEARLTKVEVVAIKRELDAMIKGDPTIGINDPRRTTLEEKLHKKEEEVVLWRERCAKDLQSPALTQVPHMRLTPGQHFVTAYAGTCTAAIYPPPGFKLTALPMEEDADIIVRVKTPGGWVEVRDPPGYQKVDLNKEANSDSIEAYRFCVKNKIKTDIAVKVEPDQRYH